MPRENRAHVTPGDDLSESLLAPQLENVEEGHVARERRMMQRQDRAERRRFGEAGSQPFELYVV